MAHLISPALSLNLRVALLGPKSAEIAQALGVQPAGLEGSDCAVFSVSAKTAFDPVVVSGWSLARDLYIPSIVAVVDLEDSELDIEEMSAIIGKAFDPVVTPYLVLHANDGAPTALIDLSTQEITVYSYESIQVLPSEPEHQTLIQEFRNEYLDQLEALGDDAFAQGLLFPAIPVVLDIGMGIREIAAYLHQLHEVPSSA